MKESILVKARELWALFVAAMKCEYAVISSSADIGQLCGSCIYCWIMRKIMVFVMFALLGVVAPVSAIIFFLAYIYFAREDFKEKLDL